VLLILLRGAEGDGSGCVEKEKLGVGAQGGCTFSIFYFLLSIGVRAEKEDGESVRRFDGWTVRRWTAETEPRA